MRVTNERGFTLLEVIVVITVVILLLGAAILFGRPQDYANTNSDSDRQLGIAAIAQALREYKQNTGDWPLGIPAKDTSIATGDGNYNLCPFLVPHYLQGIPLDPAAGTQYTGQANSPTYTDQRCDVSGVQYVSGYVIRKDDKGITVSAGSTVGIKLDVTIQ